MKRDNLIFAIAGVVFGFLAALIILLNAQSTPVPVVQTAPAAGASAPANTPPSLDAARVADLERRAAAEPANAAIRVELGNLYFDAERFDESIQWYEAATKLDPKNVSASTDLAVAYYYSQQIDRALAQLDRSLAIDPKHLKSLLNQGIIKAFGKKDLAGAADSWKKVVSLAPDSEEGRRAQQGLDGLNAAHQGTGAAPGTGTSSR